MQPYKRQQPPPKRLAMKHPKQWKRSRFVVRKGAIVVEAALIMPIFLIFMIGICNIALISIAGISGSAAAQAGCLYGSQSEEKANDTTGIQTAAQNNSPNASVTSSVSTDANGQQWLSVTVVSPTNVVLLDGLGMPTTTTTTYTYPIRQR